jgi:hypothetical protein
MTSWLLRDSRQTTDANKLALPLREDFLMRKQNISAGFMALISRREPFPLIIMQMILWRLRD